MSLILLLSALHQVQPGNVTVKNPDGVWSRQGHALTTGHDYGTDSMSGDGWSWSWTKHVHCTYGHVHTTAHDHTETLGYNVSTEGVMTGVETWKYNGQNVKGLIDEQLLKRIDGRMTFTITGSGGTPEANGAVYGLVQWRSTTQEPPSKLEVSMNFGTSDGGSWNTWLYAILAALDPPISNPTHVSMGWGTYGGSNATPRASSG